MDLIDEQHVIGRPAALAGRGDEDLQLRLHLRLTDVLLQAPRTDGALDGLLLPACDPASDSLRFHWPLTPAPRLAAPAGSILQSSVYRDRRPSASVSPPPDGIRGRSAH